MKRNEALKFMRDNSRLITSMLANPIKKADIYDSYEPIYFEQRMGNNGTPFIIQDMGKNGWDIYFISGVNNVDKSMEKFAAETGCQLPIEDITK